MDRAGGLTVRQGAARASAPRRAATRAAAIGVGGLALLWPALLNGYPLLFSDTGAFLAQTVATWPVWDKPFVYGPLLHAAHWRWSLWPAVAAQALLLSWLLWLAQRAWRGQATAGVHLGIVAALALLTPASWIAALLLPDALTPALVLALGLLGAAWDRLSWPERGGLGAVALLAAASHPSHLPLAAALTVLALGLRGWRAGRRCAAPVAGAVLLLVASNGLLHGHASISPFGSVFLLARLQDDGPAARTVAARCAELAPPNWRLCAWRDRLPLDSDAFLWAPDGPVWSVAGRSGQPAAPATPGSLDGRPPGVEPQPDPLRGPIGLAPEAAAIVRETLAREPLAVAGAALRNGWTQLGRFRIGDTLVPDHLAASVGRQLALGFPAGEQARFAAGLQARGLLPDAAAAWMWPHGPAIALGVLGLAVALWRQRADRARLLLVLAVPAALLVNAAVTGALSKPHDRYQARLIWLLPLAGLAALSPRRPAPPPRRAT